MLCWLKVGHLGVCGSEGSNRFFRKNLLGVNTFWRHCLYTVLCENLKSHASKNLMKEAFKNNNSQMLFTLQIIAD